MLGLINVGWLGGGGENEDAFIMIEYVIKAVLSHAIAKQTNKWGMAHIRLEETGPVLMLYLILSRPQHRWLM